MTKNIALLLAAEDHDSRQLAARWKRWGAKGPHWRFEDDDAKRVNADRLGDFLRDGTTARLAAYPKWFG